MSRCTGLPALAVLAMLLAAGASAYPGRTVTIILAGETLKEALPKVGEAAGERLACGQNAADRRIFLYTTGRELDDVKERMKRFIPYPPGTGLWFKDGSSHVFDEDLVSRNARGGAAEKRLREMTALRRKRFAEVQEWARPVEGDRLGLANYRRQLSGYLQLIESLPPRHQRAALAGGRFEVPYGALPSHAQVNVRRIIDPHNRGKDPSHVGVEVSPSVFSTPESPGMRVVLWGPRQPGGGRSGEGMSEVLNPPKWDPANGADFEYLRKSHWERVRGPKDRAKNPALQAKITLQGGQGRSVEKVLGELHDLTRLPVLGEYDPCIMHGWPPPHTTSQQTTLNSKTVVELPLWQALDVVTKRFDLDWDYHQGWLLIRSPRTVLSWTGEAELSPPQESPTANP